MVRMAELNRLLHVVVLPGVVARKIQEAEDAAEGQEERDDRQNAEPRINVGLALEELAHRASVATLSEPEQLIM